MNKKDYSSAIKKTPFEYLRSKQIGSMMKDGMLYNELFENVSLIMNCLLFLTKEEKKCLTLSTTDYCL